MSTLSKQAIADEPFWGTKPEILWQDTDHLLDFVPSNDMAENENCNALTRFFLYLSLIIAIKRNSVAPLLTFGVVPAALIYVYWQRRRRPHESVSNFLRSLFFGQTITDRFAPLTKGYSDPYHGRIPNPATSKCRVPNFQNPYMNPLQSMWGTKEANIKACDMDDPNVQKVIRANDAATGWFDNDPADLYANQQGQRELQFHAQDYLVPDYYGESRDWFYKPPAGVKTRKEGGAYTPYVATEFGKQPKDGWVMPELQGIGADE